MALTGMAIGGNVALLLSQLFIMAGKDLCNVVVD